MSDEHRPPAPLGLLLGPGELLIPASPVSATSPVKTHSGWWTTYTASVNQAYNNNGSDHLSDSWFRALHGSLHPHSYPLGWCCGPKPEDQRSWGVCRSPLWVSDRASIKRRQSNPSTDAEGPSGHCRCLTCAGIGLDISTMGQFSMMIAIIYGAWAVCWVL